MADFPIRISVDSGPANRGTDQVIRRLSRLNLQAARTRQAMEGIANKGVRKMTMEIERTDKATSGLIGTVRKLAVAFGLVAAARRIAEGSDRIQTLRNRIAAVAEEGENTAQTFQRLRQIAKDSRTALAGTVEAYSRTTIAAKEFGATQQEVLQFTSLLGKAIQLSGAASQEARNAMIQLSQGMASGTLRGDELRSVLEQLPTVADLIAKQIGVTRGQLREMGADGKIAGIDVFEAILNAREEIEDNFATSVETTGQQIQAFSDDVDVLVDRLDGLVGVLIRVANAAVKGFNEVGELVDQLGVGVATGEFGVRLRGRALTQAALELEIARKEGRATGAADQILGGLEKLGGIGGAEIIESARRPLKGKTLPELREMLRISQEQSAEDERQRRLEEDAVRRRREEAEFEKERQALEREADQRRKKRERDAARAGARRRRENEEALRFLQSVDSVRDAEGKLLDVKTLLQRAVDRLGLSQERASEIMGIQKQLLEDQLDPLGAVVRELEEELRLIDMSEAARERHNKLREIENELLRAGKLLTVDQRLALIELIDAQLEASAAAERRAATEKTRQDAARRAAEDEQQVLRGIRGDEEDQLKRREILQRLLERGTITQREFNKAMAEMEEPLGRLGEFGVQSINRLADSLAEFATTGKFQFRSLVDSMLADLTRLLIKMAILRTFTALGGDPSGSFGRALGGALGGFATGGSFIVPGSGGTDSTPVAFMATPGERVDVSTPAQQQQMGAGAPPNVNIRVVNTQDPDAAIDALNSAAGERVLINTLRRNSQAVKQALRIRN